MHLLLTEVPACSQGGEGFETKKKKKKKKAAPGEEGADDDGARRLTHHEPALRCLTRFALCALRR